MGARQHTSQRQSTGGGAKHSEHGLAGACRFDAPHTQDRLAGGPMRLANCIRAHAAPLRRRHG